MTLVVISIMRMLAGGIWKLASLAKCQPQGIRLMKNNAEDYDDNGIWTGVAIAVFFLVIASYFRNLWEIL